MMTDPDKIFSKEESSCLSFNVMMDYIHDRLSDKERNHIEKHMLQCEFCSEAMDGLSLIDENKGKEIIESIDETNHLEQQILFAASAAPVLEESAVEYEMDSAPMRAASVMKSKKKAETPPSARNIQEINNKSTFDWMRLAAVLIGALFIGGGLIYLIRNDFNAGGTRVAIESKPSVDISSEPKINNGDTVIAIAPSITPSGELRNKAEKTNSDALLHSDNEAEGRKESIIELKDRAPADEFKKISPAASNAVTQDALSTPIKEEAESVVEKNKDKRLEEVKVESYSVTQLEQKKELRTAKSKKGDIRSAAAEVKIAADTIAVDEYKTNSDFDKGVQLYAKGEYQKAISYFEKLEKKDNKYEEARWYLAKSYLVIGEKEKAKIVFKEVVEMNGVFKGRAEAELKKIE